MELKHTNAKVINLERDVLIVPYGIETPTTFFKLSFMSVLIVPYGIETRFVCDMIEPEAWC